MRNIALATVYSKMNYGTVLQAYATQKVMDRLGYHSFTIDCRGIEKYNKRIRNLYFLKHIFEKDMLKSKVGFLTKKVYLKFDRKLKNNEKNRKSKFDAFIYQNFRMCPAFTNLGKLSKYIAENVYAVVVGSDQIWLPQHILAGYYTLQWVPHGIKRISLSSSFGKEALPSSIKNKASFFLNELDVISVRENAGRTIVEDLCGREATVLCDPTMMLEEAEWEELASGERLYKGKYIFCYFLGKNPEHRKIAKKIKEKTGYKIVACIHMDEYIPMDEKYADETPFSVGPAEFLNYIKNAEMILTDSFHGTVFSILFKKKFWTFNRFNSSNKMSTNNRISTLLNRVGLCDRLWKQDSFTMLEMNIDYEKVHIIVGNMRDEAQRFIQQALGKAEQPQSVAEFIKSECTGCSSCMNICAKRSIKMERDVEGFLYPVVDKSSCVNCRRCIEVCPVHNKVIYSEYQQRAFLVQNINKEVRLKSTSGGLFAAVANIVQKKGGVVFGAAYTSDYLKVKHIKINQNEDVSVLSGSKYVQSDCSSAYQEIRELLQNRIMVCYCGTPCQVEGLLSFLGGKDDNLLLIDVVCRGVPSPMIWEQYVKGISDKANSMPDSASFRDKGLYGYRYSQMSLTFNGKKRFLGGVDNNPYLRSFFENVNVRPSCFSCRFRSRYRKSDITMWDCLDIADYTSEMDTYGTTRVLVHTELGDRIINEVSSYIRCMSISPERAIQGVDEMNKSKIVSDKREVFFSSMEAINDVNGVLNKFFPSTFLVRVEHAVRVMGVKTGAYYGLKKIVKKFRK